jgi:hypothetical protein
MSVCLVGRRSNAVPRTFDPPGNFCVSRIDLSTSCLLNFANRHRPGRLRTTASFRLALLRDNRLPNATVEIDQACGGRGGIPESIGISITRARGLEGLACDLSWTEP